MQRAIIEKPSDHIAALLDVFAQRVADRIVAHLDEQIRAEPPPALLDRAGLARQLGVSVPTVDRLRREGCPTVRVGDVPRFELQRVLDFLREKGTER